MRKRFFAVLICFVFSFLMAGITDVRAASKSVTVTTKKGLSKALADTSTKSITIKTDKATKFTIPKEELKKKLIIDAPNATLINSAKFSKITVKNVNAYTEKASGNNIVVKDSEASVTVYKKAEVASISAVGKELNLVAQSGSKINSLECTNEETVINLKVSATAEVCVELEKAATVNIEGKGKEKVQLTGAALSVAEESEESLQQENEDETSTADNIVYPFITEEIVDGITIHKAVNEDGSYSITKYDSAGKLLYEATVDALGNIIDCGEYTYHSNGKKAEQRFIFYNGEKSVKRFHENGKKAYVSYEYTSGLVATSYYNEDGKVYYEISSGGHLSTSIVHTYEYYPDGKLKKVTQSGEYGEFITEYDENGKVIVKNNDTDTDTGADEIANP